MSNTGTHNNKVIQIKPIEVLKKDPIPTENEGINEIQNELQIAKNELQSLIQQKEKLLNETKKEIEVEKENWSKEKQLYIEKAKEEGHTAGIALGKEESLKQYEELLTKANSITDLVIKDYHSTIEKSENTILNLSIHTAEKIIKEKLETDPSSFLRIVKAAIKEITDQSVISIYLHPEKYEFVLKQKDELLHILENDTKLSIYMNDELDENSCLIQHPFGQIDAGIDTQLEEIRTVLHEIAMENKQ
ncbi:flagellar assembly protein FliH [Virgibacillus profundi]|uniref:flagellar assembly protein FliH n=1 Tax=Virgibacillus profundi TaxID=2024555 RepID=UPI0013FD6816|nr:flagellar assembly protein FliH [Virgibacillus profundi]